MLSRLAWFVLGFFRSRQPVERDEPEVEDEQLEKDEPVDVEGAGPDGGDYEQELARYLQERIKPNLTRSTIPLLARSIAKDLAKRQQQDSSEQDDDPAKADATDFERDMHELQAELGDEWILRFSRFPGRTTGSPLSARTEASGTMPRMPKGS